MLPSRSPSATELSARALALAGLGAAAIAPAGCSDDACGPGGAPDSGLVASSGTVTLTYGNLSGLLGNDCPDPAAPEGVISLSIESRQVGDPTGLLTFCIPRPDLLMQGDRTLGHTSSGDVRIVDLRGNADGCAFEIDRTRLPTGAAQATGVCDNGGSPDGFALALDGAVSLRRTCGGTVDTVDVTLRGRVAVSHREQ